MTRCVLVHPPGVAGVLDLEAQIHDDRQAAILRDARTFLGDHRELTPQALGAEKVLSSCRPRRTGVTDGPETSSLMAAVI